MSDKNSHSLTPDEEMRRNDANWKIRAQKYFHHSLLFTLVYILVILILYYGVIRLPEICFGYRLDLPAIVYIILSASSIILTTWGEEISNWVKRLLVKEKSHTIHIKVVDEKKIRMILILVYFILIVVFTIASLTSHPIFLIEKMDYSVIQSFATYIAYDRLIRNYSML